MLHATPDSLGFLSVQPGEALVLDFCQIDLEERKVVGEKNLSLGHGYRNLCPLGVNVAYEANRDFLRPALLASPSSPIHPVKS